MNTAEFKKVHVTLTTGNVYYDVWVCPVCECIDKVSFTHVFTDCIKYLVGRIGELEKRLDDHRL
jgi:hypothetical protein